MASFPSASTGSSSLMSSSSSSSKISFGLFPYLHDDLKLMILSFVADAPMEAAHDDPSYTKSSLTHQLPHVSRKFRDLSQADSYWKDAVLRQTKKEPLWKSALQDIIAEHARSANMNENESNVNGGSSSSSHKKKPRASASSAHVLVQQAMEAHTTATQQSSMGCGRNTSYQQKQQQLLSSSHNKGPARKTFKSLYRHVVSNHLRFKSPVFFMPGQVQLGEPYALHFFEPRYRFLIAEVMRDFPLEAKQGGHISSDNGSNRKVPLFLHANRGPLAPTTPAVVVQVLRCHIHANNNGRADVVLLPLHHVWLEKLWIRPNSGNLYYAQALRMPQQVSRSMNQLARQEALAHVMDQISTTLSSCDSDDDDDDAMDSDDDDDDGSDENHDASQGDFSESDMDDDDDDDDDDLDDDDFEHVRDNNNENDGNDDEEL